MSTIHLHSLNVLQTSLLEAIIGDMTKIRGELLLYGSVAYASQDPWLAAEPFHVDRNSTICQASISICSGKHIV